MTDTTAIATKIKALLAKAASTTNQHEAEAFLAKAHELMEKYQLDALDLEVDDPMGDDMVCKRNGKVTPDWDFRLVRGCALYYGCEAIRWYENGHWYQKLVGRESARLTTVAMHAYLVATVRKLGRENAAEMYCNADQAARRIGTMLNERLISLRPKPERSASTTAAGKNALVTMDALQAYMDRNMPGLRTVKSSGTIRSKSAQGIAAGIGINVQAGSRASTLRIK